MPINARRRHLEGLLNRGKGSNLGLYFNRYVEQIDLPHEGGDCQEYFLNSLCAPLDEGTLEIYRQALNNWREVAEADPETEVFELETVSPLICGTGNKNALEIGATFMHPYGMPYIPGSSIKGVASSYAEGAGGDTWRKTNAGKYDGGEASVILFGGIQKKKSFSAAVDILDAWWMPIDATSPFMLDILTPHQKSYYAEKGFPDGTDSPVPVTFLVLKPGQKFIFAVRGQEPLRKLAKTIIRQAFEVGGAGGKTRSGYGRFAYLESESDILDAVRQAQTPEELKQRLGNVEGEWHRKDHFVQACAVALNRFEYSQELDTCFKHALPIRWLLERIRGLGNPTTYAAVNALRKANSRLGFSENDRSNSEVQDLFRLCVTVLPRADIREWLVKIAYTWEDRLAGKTVDEIMGIVGENDPWLRPEDAAAAIQGLTHLSEGDKQELIAVIG